jgi:hypothetical protein
LADMASPKDKVVLRRHGQLLSVRPPCPEGLSRLQGVDHVMMTDRQHGTHLRAEAMALYRVDAVEGGRGDVDAASTEAGFTMAGLELPATMLLRRQGYDVRGPEQVASLPSPQVEAVSKHGLVDQGMLDLVRHRDRGMIYYGPRVNPRWLTAQLALAYPELSIVVATANHTDTARVSRALRRWLPGQVTQLRSDHIRKKPTRVVVGNCSSLPGCLMDLEHRELAVVIDLVAALGVQAMTALCGAESARLFGMLPLGAELAPQDRDLLAGLYGFHHCHVPRPGCKPLPVDVVILRDVARGRMPKDAKEDVVRRALIWQHTPHNRTIARIARDLHGDAHQWLQWYPRLTKSLRDRSTVRVALLVANVEHALDMAKRLPSWRLAIGPEVNTDGLAPRDQAILCKRTQLPAGRLPSIVTISGVDRIDPRKIDVLIRADAGTGLPPIAANKLAVPPDSNHRLLLVDFDDMRHHVLRRASRQRRRCYRDRGWCGPGNRSVIPRVKDYLAARP